MIVFDGKKFARQKEKALKIETKRLTKKLGFRPKLVAIMVGDNPASQLYLRKKSEAARRIGIELEKKEFPAHTKPDKIISFINSINADPKVAGVMVQLPLPKELGVKSQELGVLDSIEPSKDVDCLTSENLGRLMINQPRFLPATVKAVLETIYYAFSRCCNSDQHPVLIRFEHRDFEDLRGFLRGKDAVVVGAGRLVGMPLVVVLSNLGATVTICRSKTKSLADFTKRADILVCATGVPGLIKKAMVKKGVVVVDVGALKAEVDFAQVKKVASFITPVPGGVGPMTVICLLENVTQAIVKSSGLW